MVLPNFFAFCLLTILPLTLVSCLVTESTGRDVVGLSAGEGNFF